MEDKENRLRKLSRREFIKICTAAAVAAGLWSSFPEIQEIKAEQSHGKYYRKPQLKLLDVDLTNGTFRDETIDDETVKKFAGGRGLGAYLLYDKVSKGTDPLGPDNVILVLTGPATGTGFPSSGRHHIIAKSPLTGTIGDSNSGGLFGAMLRRTGYDGIVIRGAADAPVYLSITDGRPELRDATLLWGRGVSYTDEKIKADEMQKRKCGGKMEKESLLCIGPAGENLVPIANVMNDKHRAAGRTGLGSVFGSKRLKAIYVDGGGTKPGVYDPMTFKAVVEEKLNKIETSPFTALLRECGTLVGVDIINSYMIWPTKNFQECQFPGAGNINCAAAVPYKTGQKGCWQCTIKCTRLSEVPAPSPYQVEEIEGPEYETTWAMGADCGIDNFEAIIKANGLCNDMGLDTMSFGTTVATAMELNQEGKIDGPYLQGLLTWGNPEAIVELAEKTAYREGFGDDVARGARWLAEKYGMPEAAMQVKGLELPAYDPRGAQGQGLAYATSNRGGCHLRAYTIGPEIFTGAVPRCTTEGKAGLVFYLENLKAVIDSLVVCSFTGSMLTDQDYLDLINPLTGWNWTLQDMLLTGERIYNMERMFSAREGVGIEDTLPTRLLTETTPSCGGEVDLDPMLGEYYAIRGWVDGVPTSETLARLGL